MRHPGRVGRLLLGCGVVLVAALSAGCGPAATAASGPASPAGAGSAARTTGRPPGTSTSTIEVDGLTRSYRVFRPSPGPGGGRWPLVVFLHGGFGTAAQAERSYGWDALAAREHVLVAYPDGRNRAWNVGGGCCGVPGRTGTDDVAFVTAMVAAIEAQIPVDRTRVYATGISNGGMLAYRLACDSRMFAAIGPDSATMLGACPDPSPISVVHVHGTADTNIPYDGGRGSGIARIDGPAVPTVVADWRAVDHCADAATTVRGVVTTSVATCPGGRAVELITIAGAGHQWPGASRHLGAGLVPGLDVPSSAIDATTTIWNFFAAHPASAG